MIEVFIVKNGEALATIEIVNRGGNYDTTTLSDPNPITSDFADYSVKFGIDRGSAVGVHSRMMYGFPRTYFNVLGLVRQALNTLDEKELKLEPGYDIDSHEAALPADLARRLRDRVREIQARFR